MEKMNTTPKRKVSELHLTYLRAFSPNSYGMSIPHSIAKTMEIKGLVEWVPPKFGTTLYAITDKGREAVRVSTEQTPQNLTGEQR